MVLTMIVLAVMTGLGVTVYALSVDNLDNARRDRQASSALANSEAGVAQAISYIKNRGVGRIACAPTCGAANPWGEEPGSIETPDDGFPSHEVTLASGERYSVWFETLAAMTPTSPGRYLVHSIGNSGSSPAARRVEVVVEVAPFEFPLAVVADSVQAGGNGSIQTESLFSTGCIFKRDKIFFQGMDPVYGIPAAAHSTQIITNDQVNGGGSGSCPTDNNKNIHYGPGGVSRPCPADPQYRYDQDSQGGSLAATSCLGAGGAYPQTSLIADEADMEAQYGFNLAGLTQGQIDQLRTSSQEQGFYSTGSNAIPAVLQGDVSALQHPNPVVFYEFAPGVGTNARTVDLNDLSQVVYGRNPQLAGSAAGCHSRNVIVVVINGDVKLNSNQSLVGSVFAMGPAPYGNVTKANGTSQLIGTIYARSIDLTGTANMDLDPCFLENLPGQLLNVKAVGFAEVDR